MKKNHIKQLTLRREVIAQLGKTSLHQLLGGGVAGAGVDLPDLPELITKACPDTDQLPKTALSLAGCNNK